MKKRTCRGCFAISREGMAVGCDLGFNNLDDESKADVVPLEECFKPKTREKYDRLKELIKIHGLVKS